MSDREIAALVIDLGHRLHRVEPDVVLRDTVEQHVITGRLTAAGGRLGRS